MTHLTLPKKVRLWLLCSAVIFLNIACKDTQTLFAENANDWERYGDATWTFTDGTLIGTVKEGEGFVMTQQKYGDFVLELEFNPNSTINSGVFVRCSQSDDISEVDCYEINIWDLHTNPDYRTGAIVKRAVPLAKVDTNDQWNTYKIKVEGNHVQAWINGTKTADLEDDSLGEGYIALQAKETGEIKFRNIKITSL